MKRIIWTIAAALVTCALAWLGGFNFDTRGPNAAALAAAAIFFAGAAWFWPGLSDK